jgi:hypothetical protein
MARVLVDVLSELGMRMNGVVERGGERVRTGVQNDMDVWRNT